MGFGVLGCGITYTAPSRPSYNPRALHRICTSPRPYAHNPLGFDLPGAVDASGDHARLSRMRVRTGIEAA